MEDFVRQAMLFDFYGDLLNDHQREVYDSYIRENLSLGEIADSKGISRQGVFDVVKRCRSILEDYEKKLHLLERFLEIRKKVEMISGAESVCQARSISREILELL